MIRRTVIVVIAATFVGLLVFVFLSWRPAPSDRARCCPDRKKGGETLKGDSVGGKGSSDSRVLAMVMRR
jgi:hypothetical protein